MKHDPRQNGECHVCHRGAVQPPSAPDDQRADVRQYFGPAFLVDGGSLALASPRPMNGATNARQALQQALEADTWQRP